MDQCEYGPSDPLLPRVYDESETTRHGRRPTEVQTANRALRRVLPLPFLASIVMSVTVAPTVYVFQSLACKDRDHCTDKERRSYAGSVAVANMIAHFVSIFVIGLLQTLIRKDARYALLSWIVSRGMSIAALPVAVLFRSMSVALAGRIFEGAASDNSLHFILNMIYTEAPAATQSKFMGTSFGLFMVGMALGPVLGGVFDDYQISFAIGGAGLAVSAIYLWIAIPGGGLQTEPQAAASNPHLQADPLSVVDESTIGTILLAPFRPLRLYFRQPVVITFGVSIFLFTAVQAYLFQAILIHTSIAFNFSTAQNGLIITTAATMSAVYLALILWLLPASLAVWKRLRRGLSKDSLGGDGGRATKQGSGWFEATVYLVCVSIQALALFSLKWLYTAELFLTAIGVIALGLGMGSFLKSWVALKTGNGVDAMAALAMMETFGALASPVVLGAWQSLHSSDGTTFVMASFMLGLSAVAFLVGALVFDR